MALITLPTAPAFKTSDWGLKTATAVSRSPFTGHEQVYNYDLALWYAVLTLPPMSRDQAALWTSFFLKMRGRKNTFLVGDPDAKSTRGTATSCTITASASIGDTTVSVNIGAGKTLKEGDYIQFGGSASAKLYMITDNAAGDASGDVDITIEPPLKTAVTTSTSVVIDQPKCVMRLDSNELTWTANEVSVYGISFSCTEAFA